MTRTRHERVEVLCSNRDTNKAEDLVSTQTAREHAFMHTLRGPDREYDWILIDCAPSIGLFQACAMVYARKVLVPVAMETLSVQGAISAVNAADTLSRLLVLEPPIEIVGDSPSGRGPAIANHRHYPPRAAGVLRRQERTPDLCHPYRHQRQQAARANSSLLNTTRRRALPRTPLP